MTLGEFKNFIEKQPEDRIFDYGISYPFSWRGVYSEVAFTLVEGETSKASILEMIQAALDDEFIGWKGGEYRYNEDTDIHFEPREGRYTDGEYCKELIAKITKKPTYPTLQEHLVNVAFS